MGCISSAPVEPEVDEFEGDPLAELKRRKRDLEQEVKGARMRPGLVGFPGGAAPSAGAEGTG